MEKAQHKSWLRVFAWKLIKSIGIALFIIICAKVGAFFATGGKGTQTISSIANYFFLGERLNVTQGMGAFLIIVGVTVIMIK